MQDESLDMEQLTEERRRAILQSIKPITYEDLNKLGNELFPFVDHPWHEVFFTFIRENRADSFYEARTHDNVHLIYCHQKDRGMWFLPKLGMGPLQAKGLAIMKKAAEGIH